MTETIDRSPLTEEQHQQILTQRSGPTWDAIRALCMNKGRVPYEKLGITFEKDGRFTIVKKDCVSVAHMSHQFSRKALLEAVISNAQSDAKRALEFFGQAFIDSLLTPDDYTIRHEQERDLRHIAAIGSNNSSIFIGNPNVDMYDDTQIAAEFRIFFDRPRATVWVSQGPQHSFESTSLLDEGRSAFLYADTYAQLADKVRELFHEVTHEPFESLKTQAASRPRP